MILSSSPHLAPANQPVTHRPRACTKLLERGLLLQGVVELLLELQNAPAGLLKMQVLGNQLILRSGKLGVEICDVRNLCAQLVA